MAHIQYHPAEAARLPILRSVVTRFGRAIAQNFRTRAERRARQRRVRRIEHLDDRMLRDIGITRADLDYAISHPEAPDDNLRRRALTNRNVDLERPRLRAH